MAEKKDSVSIVYEEPPSRPYIAATGAFGNPSPDGASVIANLYIEAATVPAREDHDIAPGGYVDFTKGNQIRRGDLTRTVVATMVLSPEASIRLGRWLVEKGEEASAHREKNKP